MKIEHSSLDKLAKILFFVVLRFLIVGTSVMLLWNWLLPGLINAMPIKFYQAVGLMVLGRLLTGSLKIGFGLSTMLKKNNDDNDLLEDDEDEDSNYRARLKDDLRERCKSFGQKSQTSKRDEK